MDVAVSESYRPVQGRSQVHDYVGCPQFLVRKATT